MCPSTITESVVVHSVCSIVVQHRGRSKVVATDFSVSYGGGEPTDPLPNHLLPPHKRLDLLVFLNLVSNAHQSGENYFYRDTLDSVLAITTLKL